MTRPNRTTPGRVGQAVALTGLLAALASVSIPTAAGPADPEGMKAGPKVEYNRDVRPILSDNCFPCHGPDPKQRKAKLRLDTREGALEDRAGSVAVVPGNAEESELVARLFSDEPDEVMPPPGSHKTLTAAQKETLRRWVEQGAGYQTQWAYLPLKRPAVPTVADESRVRNPVDAFVQSVLEGKSLKPSPEADRRTLVRRLSLDLIGLPPTPAEVRAFLADESPRAYEDLVDRLLASPHYGERMAQGWLDVARYADTVGFHGDQNQNAWPYRDYVVNAYNTNKPFDQFTVEQLAGDLLPDPTPEQRTATCFNRLNMVTREGGAQAKEYLAKSTADRVRTVGMVWLGSTLNCCECHDHKFDPFTAKDFYALGAFFADVRQWGVYADYAYTPNPDLRGWTNDHPWPPEIVVDSPALKRRIEAIDAAVTKAVDATPPPADGLKGWREEMLAFLKANPDGWETPTPSVKAAAPASAKKGTAKKAASRSGQPAPPAVRDDGRVVFSGPASNDEIELTPTPGWLAAIRLELLPEPSQGGRIVRNGDRARIKPVFSVIGADGKAKPVGVRHAQADRHAPRYVNGFDVIGVQGGWTTEPKDVKSPHSAVYFLDRPVSLAKGDRLRVTIPADSLAAVRVSTSPLSPPDVGRPEFPAGLAVSNDDPATNSMDYARSTAWNAGLYETLKRLDSDRLECRGGKTPVMVTERTEKPLTIRVLRRGNWMDETGEVCKPMTPGFLPRPDGADSRTLTRLDLARWLCAPENPLTARVVVNRLWRQFFGNGLSGQVDDLGAQGEPPSHPELLDWLGVEFRDSGWDVKRAVKTLVMSHTYRQSSAARPELRESDPNNRLLLGQNPRRLEAEAVRDNALAIAGLLNPEVGGPPSHPYQPAGYYEGLQFPDREYAAETDARQYRRGVYSHWQRTFLHPMLANFDAPSREDCVAMRTVANSPQQALTLLNDPEFVEAARVWAARLTSRNADGDAARLDLAFQTALARPASAKEQASLLAFLSKARDAYRARPADAKAFVRVGAAPDPGKDADTVELAAWATVCRVMLNLHETITRY